MSTGIFIMRKGTYHKLPTYTYSLTYLKFLMFDRIFKKLGLYVGKRNQRDSVSDCHYVIL